MKKKMNVKWFKTLNVWNILTWSVVTGVAIFSKDLLFVRIIAIMASILVVLYNIGSYQTRTRIAILEEIVALNQLNENGKED